MNDLQNRDDIERLVSHFYTKAKTDPVIGFFFSEVVNLDWEHHIPVICDFWDGVIFGSAAYQGNPMLKHIALSQKQALLPEHFERWLLLWHTSIQELFAGERADLAINRARQIAGLMQLKVAAHGS